MDEKFQRKAAVDEIRSVLEQAGNPDVKTVRDLAEGVRSGALRAADGMLFPVVAAIRRALTAFGEEWTFGKAVPKANNVRIPGAVILVNSLEPNKQFLEAMRGSIYVKGNRALIVGDKKAILCDVSACDHEALEQEHNPDAIAKMEQFWASKGKTKNPVVMLDMALKKATNMIHLDREDDGADYELDVDELNDFKFRAGGPMTDEGREAMFNFAKWDVWFMEASDEEIREMLASGDEGFLAYANRILELNDIEEQQKEKAVEQRRRLLRLIPGGKNETDD